jgi:hypothetical protein
MAHRRTIDPTASRLYVITAPRERMDSAIRQQVQDSRVILSGDAREITEWATRMGLTPAALVEQVLACWVADRRNEGHTVVCRCCPCRREEWRAEPVAYAKATREDALAPLGLDGPVARREREVL